MCSEQHPYVMGNMAEKSHSEFAAEQPTVYLLPLETVSETYIFVCASGMTDCKTKQMMGIIPRPWPIIVPNVKTFLPVVTEIWLSMDSPPTPIPRFTTVIEPM